jgi:hypothetical protein
VVVQRGHRALATASLNAALHRLMVQSEPTPHREGVFLPEQPRRVTATSAGARLRLSAADSFPRLMLPILENFRAVWFFAGRLEGTLNLLVDCIS